MEAGDVERGETRTDETVDSVDGGKKKKRSLGALVAAAAKVAEAKRTCVAIWAVVIIICLEFFNKIDSAVAREGIGRLMGTNSTTTTTNALVASLAD